MRKTIMYDDRKYKRKYKRLKALSNQVYAGTLALCHERMGVGYIIADGKVVGHEEEVVTYWDKLKLMFVRK